MAGSVLLLVAIIALFLQTGTFHIPGLDGAPLQPELPMLGLPRLRHFLCHQSADVPLSHLVPAAHVEAPTAGSVLLASVLLKMGTYGFLRFCLPITPYAAQFFMPWMLALSVVAILYGGFTALARAT